MNDDIPHNTDADADADASTDAETDTTRPPIDEVSLNWFCWVLVNERNLWWPPRETAAECAAEDPHGIAGSDEGNILAYERGYHWGMFNAADEAIYDLGCAILGPDADAGQTHQERRQHYIEHVEERARREIERGRADGLDLDDELTYAEIREEARADRLGTDDDEEEDAP